MRLDGVESALKRASELEPDHPAHGEARQVNSRAPTGAHEIFDAFADGIEPVSPPTAQLLRRCGRDDLALSLVPAVPSWDVPHRMLAAVRWLVFAGEVEDFSSAPDPWLAFRDVLAERSD